MTTCRILPGMDTRTLIVILLPWISAATNESVSTISDEPSISDESRLISTLLERYDVAGTIARPVLDSNDAVDIEFGIRLVHLDVDEKEQVMTTSVWTRMIWNDVYLTWRLEDYGGITKIVLPVEKIWTPDIALVNTAVTIIKEQSADALVYYNGQVMWVPQRKYSSACLIDVTEYPYDRHSCDMWFQCIANPGDNVNITTYPRSPLDLDTYLSSYKDANEWKITANTSSWHKRPRDEGMVLMWSRRPALKFSLTIHRRAGFKGMLLIVPCALLSFLIPLIFCFPPERPDRHSLAMSLFGSLTILLFMVNEVAPPSASFVPRLALYYCFNLLVLLIATCFSVAVVNISKRGETHERVPMAIRHIFIKGIGKALCFGERLKHLTEVKKVSRRRPDPATHEKPQYHCLEDLETGSVRATHSTSPQCYPGHTEHHEVSEHDDRVLTQIHRKLHKLESQLSVKNVPKTEVLPDINLPMDVRVEWRTLSMVLDRLFFILFLVANFVTLAFFHPK